MYSFGEELPADHVARFQLYLDMSRCMTQLQTEELIEFVTDLIKFYEKNRTIDIIKSLFTQMFNKMVKAKPDNYRYYFRKEKIEEIRKLFPQSDVCLFCGVYQTENF